ncbi:hypothetical protein ASF48_17710 [Rathayibacter sp. Leaf299]|uniref:hypothetical protein n=1 Tax=Rathayibacter sp. Leaf299 TaxID=1736328 RepID=UPI00070068C7|nr:hypothetical protein [Rathayibacter sp. Leaf299]KQQ18754.1 hypothetical protein ASF48_17710 [Rathayibacter sp. Leaf299]
MAITRSRHAEAFLDTAVPLAQVYLPDLTAVSLADAHQVATRLQTARQDSEDLFLERATQLWSSVAAAPRDRELVTAATAAASALRADIDQRLRDLAVPAVTPTRSADTVTDGGWAERVRYGLGEHREQLDQRLELARLAEAGIVERFVLLTAMGDSTETPELIPAIRQERAVDERHLTAFAGELRDAPPLTFEGWRAAGLDDAVRIASKWTDLDPAIENLTRDIDRIIATNSHLGIPTIQDARDQAEHEIPRIPDLSATQEALSHWNVATDDLVTGGRELKHAEIEPVAQQLHAALTVASYEGQAGFDARLNDVSDRAIRTLDALEQAQNHLRELAAPTPSHTSITENRQEIAGALIDRYAALLGDHTRPLHAAVAAHDIDALVPIEPVEQPAMISTRSQFQAALRSDLASLVDGKIGPSTSSLLEQHDNVAQRLHPEFTPKPFTVVDVEEKLQVEEQARRQERGARQPSMSR